MSRSMQGKYVRVRKSKAICVSSLFYAYSHVPIKLAPCYSIGQLKIAALSRKGYAEPE